MYQRILATIVCLSVNIEYLEGRCDCTQTQKTVHIDHDLHADFLCLFTCNHATSCICLQWQLFTRFLFNDGLPWVAVTGESQGYHPAVEWNTMCSLSRRTFLLAPWFPQVIHAVLIPTVMVLCWGSAAPPGPPRFSLWPPWQHCPSAACQLRQACGCWW